MKRTIKDGQPGQPSVSLGLETILEGESVPIVGFGGSEGAGAGKQQCIIYQAADKLIAVNSAVETSGVLASWQLEFSCICIPVDAWKVPRKTWPYASIEYY